MGGLDQLFFLKKEIFRLLTWHGEFNATASGSGKIGHAFEFTVSLCVNLKELQFAFIIKIAIASPWAEAASQIIRCNDGVWCHRY